MRLAKILVHLCIALALAAGITAALVVGGVIRPRTHAPAKMPDRGPVDAFRLTERSGRPFSNADLAGKVWIADFFFTSCKGPCPTMTAAMVEVQRALADVPDVRLVSFSLDPERDTPGVLSTYADLHGASKDRWFFLTGPFDEIRSLSEKGFKIGAGKENNEVFHGTYFALVDRAGRVRGHYNVYEGGLEERARLCADARTLAAEEARP